MSALLAAILGGTLILRSGQHIEISGTAREEGGRLIFRAEGGSLYSIPMTEVDLDATRAASATEPTVVRPTPDRLRLKVSEEERKRLLRDLEQNHAGTPAPRQASLEEMPPPPTAEEKAQRKQEEWAWRNRARGYQEALRQSEEDLQLLVDRVDQLRAQIAGFLSLGYKPNQFSYQTTQLQYTLDRIPQAELEVQRARRAYDQFRDDARTEGVMPGWLR
jgi:hypothetical protein